MLKRNNGLKPQQVSISKISKGQRVSINDIKLNNRYVIHVTYSSGKKKIVLNDVTLINYTFSKSKANSSNSSNSSKSSNSKIDSISFVYNKHYDELTRRDGIPPPPNIIKDINSIEFYYTKKSNSIHTKKKEPISNIFTLNNILKGLKGRPARYRRLPQQVSISNISKGQRVSINDINLDNRYVIHVTYPSGKKLVYNDVTIKNITKSESKVKSVSIVYNKHYKEIKLRDGNSPSPHTIKDFSSIEFYYTKDSSNPISTNFSLNLKETKPRTVKLVSKSTKSSSRKTKVAPGPALYNSNSDFLKGGKK